MSKAVPLIMAQRWQWGNQITYKKILVKFCTQCIFKNMKVKALSEYYNESTQPKIPYPKPAQMFSRNFLIKLQICSAFARVSLYCLLVTF